MSDETQPILTDAIGQPLAIGDFVTAVWADGDVALFQIDSFKVNTRTSSRHWARRGDVVMLKRLFNDNCSEKTQNELVKKLYSQITKVPEDVVRDYVVMYKLSN